MAKILVLDDDQGMREFMEIMLTKEGYDVTSADEPSKAINLCRKIDFDLVITDLKMPKIDGIEFLKTIKDAKPRIASIRATLPAWKWLHTQITQIRNQQSNGTPISARLAIANRDRRGFGDTWVMRYFDDTLLL